MAATVRVGVLNDMADPAGAPGDMTDWLEREVEALRAAGRIAAPVEYVHAFALGLPSGTAEAVENAYTGLAAQEVALVVGPGIGDNALVLTPLAERMRLPTVQWSASARARGRYMFQLQGGSDADEALVIARHLAQGPARRFAVIHDDAPAGTRQLRHLEEEAAILGARIVATHGISPGAHEADAAVATLLAAEPDAVVYLGQGAPAPAPAPAIARALAVTGWPGPRIMNTAGLRGHGAEDFARACEGWAYVDLHADGNRTLAALREVLGIPDYGALPAARGHDLGRIVAEAIARAPDLTREGLRTGLEQVRWLPAAQGHEGTLLGFGNHERAGLHGRYLVVRQWRAGASFELPAA